MSASSEPRADPKIGRVVEAAAARGVSIEPVTFDRHTRTAADAARAIGCDVGQIVKSLVFLAPGGPVLFLVSGANRLDPVKAAALAGVDSFGKADADTVKRVTGFSIGAVPPIGHVEPLAVYVDRDLLAHEVVWPSAGRSDSVFAVAPDVLRALTDGIVGDLAERGPDV